MKIAVIKGGKSPAGHDEYTQFSITQEQSVRLLIRVSHVYSNLHQSTTMADKCVQHTLRDERKSEFVVLRSKFGALNSEVIQIKTRSLTIQHVD